jgi:hypothetical protein
MVKAGFCGHRTPRSRQGTSARRPYNRASTGRLGPHCTVSWRRLGAAGGEECAERGWRLRGSGRGHLPGKQDGPDPRRHPVTGPAGGVRQDRSAGRTVERVRPGPPPRTPRTAPPARSRRAATPAFRAQRPAAARSAASSPGRHCTRAEEPLLHPGQKNSPSPTVVHVVWCARPGALGIPARRIRPVPGSPAARRPLRNGAAASRRWRETTRSTGLRAVGRVTEALCPWPGYDAAPHTTKGARGREVAA